MIELLLFFISLIEGLKIIKIMLLVVKLQAYIVWLNYENEQKETKWEKKMHLAECSK